MTRVQTIQLIITAGLVLWFLACSAGCWFWYRLKRRDRKRDELEDLLSSLPDYEPVYPRWCSTCLREGRQTRVGWTTQEGEWGICEPCAAAIQERLRAKGARAKLKAV